MSKVCCIEKGVNSKSPSCPMILRSACSHRHSHGDSLVKEHSSSSSKRKHHSSVSSKSSESQFSLLNGSFHKTTDINHNANETVFEVSSLNPISCAKEIHFSQLSFNSQGSFINNINHTECSSDYCSATESDINSSESLDTISNMNTRRYERSPHPSIRSLSDTDDESDITVKRVSRLKRTTITTKEYSTNQNVLSQRKSNEVSHNNASYNRNHIYSTNNHSSRYTGTSGGENRHFHMTDSSYLDTSSEQYSFFDKFRLSFWRSIYSSLIKYINFDVWLLLRILSPGKAKVVSLLLLPLLFFLVWCICPNSSSLHESFSSATEAVSTMISSFFSFLSFVISSICSLFTRKTTEDNVSESFTEYKTFLPSLSSFVTIFSGWFSSAIVETKNDLEKRSHHVEDNIILTHAEVNDVLALNKLKGELDELKLNFQQMETDKLMYQKLLNEMKDLHVKFETLSTTMDNKEKDSVKRYQKEKSDSDEKIIAITTEYENHMDILKNKLKILENKLGVYEDLKKCCDKQWNQKDLVALIENNIIHAFKEVIGGDINSKYYFLNEWINSKFFNHESLMQEVKAALKQHSSYTEATIDFSKINQVVESAVMKHVDALKRNFSEFNSYSSDYAQDYFSENKIKKIVKEAIMLYDADKTGQVDYALESGGGSVLGTRCSETYVEKYGKISLFGVPFWTYSNSPRTAIQPDVQPGRCWAFKGSQGFLVLSLSATIYPTGFSLEHIPVSLSPAGTIDSAPKNFSVWGLDSDKDNKGNLLGEYFYDINGDPLQYFAVKIPSTKPYSHIELQVHSNHGNMEYTCLYRFRVHGKRAYD